MTQNSEEKNIFETIEYLRKEHKKFYYGLEIVKKYLSQRKLRLVDIGHSVGLTPAEMSAVFKDISSDTGKALDGATEFINKKNSTCKIY